MCSLLQMSSFTGVHTTVDPKGFEVASMIMRLSQKEHSAALLQLASRNSVVVKFGANAGAEPFAEVEKLITDLITDLINKLHSEAPPEASHKSCCDDELTKTCVKKRGP